MAVNLVTRQIQARIFLDLLNHPYFHRVFNVMSQEYISEYKIENNSLTVKILDRNKLKKLKAGTLSRPNPRSITNLGGKKFPIGRYNVVEISKLLNALNINLQFRARCGFKESEQVSKVVMFGQKSIVLTGYDKKELEENKDSINNQQAKLQPVIQPSRGTR